MKLPTQLNVYVVIVEDRHTDVAVEVFTDKDEAIEWARQEAVENASDGFIVEEVSEKDLDSEGWVYSARYSNEGDYVSVREVEMDQYADRESDDSGS